MPQLFTNNGSGSLATAVNTTDTTLVLGTGEGAKFPSPAGGDFALCTLTQGVGLESTWEIVKVTARVTDTLTVERAQEGTAAASWGVGSKLELRTTAGTLAGKESTSNKDATGGYAGLTLFKLNLRNAANTFTSWLTNANTAVRTYTLQDRDGTLADLGANTFTGAQIYSDQVLSRGMTKDMGMVFVDKGNSGTAAQTIDYSAASHQKLTVTGAFVMNAVTNWPPTGNTGELLLELVNGASSAITWTMSGTTQKWWKSDGTSVATYALSGVTFQTTGTNWILMWSTDAGTTTNFKVMT